jgi:DNA processing protein
VTLAAIKSGRLLGTGGLASTGGLAGNAAGLGNGLPRGKAHEGVKAAMERWRTRLPELPAPERVVAFGESGIRFVCPGDPEWPGQLADLGDDQPYALWLRGNADLRFSCLRSVAMVGSRADPQRIIRGQTDFPLNYQVRQTPISG